MCSAFKNKILICKPGKHMFYHANRKSTILEYDKVETLLQNERYSYEFCTLTLAKFILTKLPQNLVYSLEKRIRKFIQIYHWIAPFLKTLTVFILSWKIESCCWNVTSNRCKKAVSVLEKVTELFSVRADLW